MGIPLYKIPQVRRFYGEDIYGTDPIDFMEEDYPPIQTHCIAARITAENPVMNRAKSSTPPSSAWMTNRAPLLSITILDAPSKGFWRVPRKPGPSSTIVEEFFSETANPMLVRP